MTQRLDPALPGVADETDDIVGYLLFTRPARAPM